jgi:hypothetical protein
MVLSEGGDGIGLVAGRRRSIGGFDGRTFGHSGLDPASARREAPYRCPQ